MNKELNFQAESALKRMGFEIETVRYDSGGGYLRATGSDYVLCAAEPVALIGLLRILVERGEEWGLRVGEPDFFDEALEADDGVMFPGEGRTT